MKRIKEAEMKTHHFIRWTASAVLLLGVVYIALIAWGILSSDPETGLIRDQVRMFMEIATVVSALVLLLLSLALKQAYASQQVFFSEISVVFMTILVTLTSVVHFVSVTVSDRIIAETPLLTPLLSLNWPSVLLSIDILAWDMFFGLAFIFMGLSLRQQPALSPTRYLMILSGSLSLVGLIALPFDNMDIRYIGIFGYTVMPIISCVFLLNTIGRLEKKS